MENDVDPPPQPPPQVGLEGQAVPASMDPTDRLRELYLTYGCCMAYIAVEIDGVEGIGSAFHVGHGVFVTARHVVEGATIKEMRLTNPDLFYRSVLYPKNENGSYTILPDSPRMLRDRLNFEGALEVLGRPRYHPDA